jgi:1-acyl-sn-glycerol-3-phosphate acyltransferase
VPLPKNANALWKFLHALIRFVLSPICCRVRVEGQENVPQYGGCVIASNHNLGPDYLLLGYAASRQVYYMAKSEIFAGRPLLARFLKEVGTFPVQRGQRDRLAVDSAVHMVHAGYALGMFPEGTRSRTGALRRGKSGAARIAMAAQVPVIPAAVVNSEQVFARFKQWRRPEVIIRFGPPLLCEGELSDLATVRNNTERIMLAIAALLPPERRGVYATARKEHKDAEAHT